MKLSAKASKGTEFLSAITFILMSSASWNVFLWGQFPHWESEKKTVIVLASLDEALAWYECPLRLLVRESVWDEFYTHLIVFILVRHTYRI
jgi:hypothetical protein